VAIDAPDPADRDRVPPLDYRSPVPPDSKRSRHAWFYDTITAPSDPELRTWWAKRLSLRLALLLLFSAIAFYFGPNEVNFGKLTRPSPADFVQDVETRCVPVVRAMKEYQRDHGQWPKKMEDLAPGYLSSAEADGFVGDISKGHFFTFSKWEEAIEYDIAPGGERWIVSGGYVHGTIPVPPVTIDPTTRPSR
jgi:hypothetical protein